MSGIELAVLINTLAAAISTELSEEQLGIAAAVFTQLGDTLATIAVQRGLEQQADARQDCGTAAAAPDHSSATDGAAIVQ